MFSIRRSYFAKFMSKRHVRAWNIRYTFLIVFYSLNLATPLMWVQFSAYTCSWELKWTIFYGPFLKTSSNKLSLISMENFLLVHWKLIWINTLRFSQMSIGSFRWVEFFEAMPLFSVAIYWKWDWKHQNNKGLHKAEQLPVKKFKIFFCILKSIAINDNYIFTRYLSPETC